VVTVPAEEARPSQDHIHGRQAVLLIHGIGEQWPMATLWGLIDGLYQEEMKQGSLFSKPDRIGKVLDLRRVHVEKEAFGIKTDFYEMYWAHLLQGTTWTHVQDFVWMLIWRRRSSTPRRLSKIRCIVLAAMIVALLVWGGIYLAATTKVIPEIPGLLALVPVLLAFVWMFLKLFCQKWGLGYLGDAARYLRPSPENIAVRQQIRNAGIDVLQRLHSDGPARGYDRIVVIGHSLGSVIAYDILTYLWQKRTAETQTTPPTNKTYLHQPCLLKMESLLSSTSDLKEKLSGFQDLQYRLCHEEQSHGRSWKITDLITLGSPLTYADYLMADSKDELSKRIDRREFPSCPPTLEKGGYIAWPDPPCDKLRTLHHAALFACTRWTNMYFKRDLIGGELAPLFGCGINDIGLDGESDKGKTVKSHLMYWSESEPESCKKLKDAMCLDNRPSRESKSPSLG